MLLAAIVVGRRAGRRGDPAAGRARRAPTEARRVRRHAPSEGAGPRLGRSQPALGLAARGQASPGRGQVEARQRLDSTRAERRDRLAVRELQPR